MEQSYAEANAKVKTSISSILTKALCIIVILALFALSFMGVRYVMIVAVALAGFLVWYWPRFRKEWEYVFCNGQLDFDLIKGGEKRKHILRIELENADVVAPLGSEALDGYRHLPVKDFSSGRQEAHLYGIATRLPKQESKVLIRFEPNEKMLKMMKDKCPNIVK